MEFKFDHTQPKLLAACNITNEEIHELFKKVNEATQVCNSSSEVIETLANNFSKEELAFIIYDNTSRESNPVDMLMDFFNNIEEESTDSTTIPLSEGGKA